MESPKVELGIGFPTIVEGQQTVGELPRVQNLILQVGGSPYSDALLPLTRPWVAVEECFI
ncbi:hypothetical protein MHBO_004731 [Bonamia ostreae]|uniref:Uncharacterized protein n=1 Tax=Bonamia ostreae TaxID=126728 RepID=A0ABV2AU43_9EUKA